MQRQNALISAKTAFQAGLLALFILVAVNHQYLIDQYALATYRPSREVQAFESRIVLTREARAIFYRADPAYDDKASFNRDCDTQAHELELGCFYRGKIFILRIDDAKLASEMDVVAAHELLHAVWARLSSKQKQTLGTELTRVYETLVDEELRERMAGYAKSEPGEELNELHSILATEYPQLSPVLESHYRQYFTDRGKVVAAHMAYRAVFETRRKELESELAKIRSLKGQLGVLNRQMEAYRNAGQIDRYNALVPAQNRLVDDINNRIAGYRQGVEDYNALSRSLDSQEITDTESPAQ